MLRLSALPLRMNFMEAYNGQSLFSLQISLHLQGEYRISPIADYLRFINLQRRRSNLLWQHMMALHLHHFTAQHTIPLLRTLHTALSLYTNT